MVVQPELVVQPEVVAVLEAAVVFRVGDRYHLSLVLLIPDLLLGLVVL
jgi:hypothetical protein